MRCIKPNDGQRPSDFQAPLTLHQLRCCGVLEVTRIARAGYPTRYLHRQFAQRYHALLHGHQSGTFAMAAGIGVASTKVLYMANIMTRTSSGAANSCSLDRSQMCMRGLHAGRALLADMRCCMTC